MVVNQVVNFPQMEIPKKVNQKLMLNPNNRKHYKVFFLRTTARWLPIEISRRFWHSGRSPDFRFFWARWPVFRIFWALWPVFRFFRHYGPSSVFFFWHDGPSSFFFLGTQALLPGFSGTMALLPFEPQGVISLPMSISTGGDKHQEHLFAIGI